jgi:ubiquinone/menaquinone biosynthesis C-methylase UbiE
MSSDDRHQARPASYVPALRFHWLTSLYDPMIQRWIAAAQIRAAIIEALALQPGMRILELGSGPGRLAVSIKQQYPDVLVEAVDADPKMIARARVHAEESAMRVHFQQQDITRLVDTCKFDRIYSTMVFHHLSPAAKAQTLTAARNALRPGGYFVVADFGLPLGRLQRALFRCIQQPLDGFENTGPHINGRYHRAVCDVFPQVQSAAKWKTMAGTIEMLICRDQPATATTAA